MTNLGADFSEGRFPVVKDTSVRVLDGDGLRINLKKHLGEESLVIDLGGLVMELTGRWGKKMREELEEKGII